MPKRKLENLQHQWSSPLVQCHNMVSICHMYRKILRWRGNIFSCAIDNTHLNPPIPASLKARCVRRRRLMRDRPMKHHQGTEIEIRQNVHSWGLSYACSISANSSRWDWFKRPLTLYASLSFSSASTSNLVSCLYDRGLRIESQLGVLQLKSGVTYGKGIGANEV